MKNPIVLAILVVSGLILLAGCGGGMARFIVIPDSRKYSATQDFNVLEASALPDHFIKVAVLIDNQSGEQLPFTPALGLKAKAQQRIQSTAPKRIAHRHIEFFKLASHRGQQGRKEIRVRQDDHR